MTNQKEIVLQESIEAVKDVELVWITNLTRETSDQEIVNFFEKFVGPVDCLTKHHNADGHYMCKAAIYFHQPDHARKALFYDGTKLGGRRMNLKLFVNQKRVYKDQIVIPGPVYSTLLPTSKPTSLENRSYAPLTDYVIYQDFQNNGQFHQSQEPEVTQDFIPLSHESSQSDSVREEYLFVSNLQYSTTGKQILDYFEEWVGPVQSVGICLDDKGFLNGKAKITFRQPDDARRALVLNYGTRKLNGRSMIFKHIVNGKPMRANWIFSLLNSMAEYFPGDPILDTTFISPSSSKLEFGIEHPQGPGIPPFLPLVFAIDCVRPYKPPV
jgi:RNA recognition motif-containing protein